MLQKNNDLSDKDKEFLQNLSVKDKGTKALNDGQKLLDELIGIERNLEIQEKEKKIEGM